MNHICYQQNELMIEALSAQAVAQRFGTPLYVYAKSQVIDNYRAFQQGLSQHSHQICYAVKANSNLTILRAFVELGASFDIVSLGELERVLLAGGKPQQIIFSGVGKTPNEIARALEVGIQCFNVESAAELTMLAQSAQLDHKIAPIALRVNPNIDAQTHPYISTGLSENKFGIPIHEAITLYQQAAAIPSLKIMGIAFHIGSQLISLEPLKAAILELRGLINQLNKLGITLHHIDVGGGLGVRYVDEQPPSPLAYGKLITELLDDRPEQIIIAPGRSLIANAGILLTQVILIKQNAQHRFAVVDAAMNDMLRPAIYQAFHTILPVSLALHAPTYRYDVVGPICESGDFLGKSRELAIETGSLLALMQAGAYGFTMSSQYNSRPRSAEVLVEQATAQLIRPRESLQDLFQAELAVATWQTS